MLSAALNADTSLVTVKNFPKSVIEAVATSVPAGRKERQMHWGEESAGSPLNMIPGPASNIYSCYIWYLYSLFHF